MTNKSQIPIFNDQNVGGENPGGKPCGNILCKSFFSAARSGELDPKGDYGFTSF